MTDGKTLSHFWLGKCILDNRKADQQKERKKTDNPRVGGMRMGGRCAATTQGFYDEECGASRRPP